MCRRFLTPETVRILIAPDSFKGSLTSAQASKAMAKGISDAMIDADIELLPLADGGEGTLEVLLFNVLHDNNTVMHDNYAIISDNYNQKTMLIESARFLGLDLQGMEGLNIFDRGSGKLGNCIRHGLDLGLRRFAVGLGGSATNDFGLGMLISLGMIGKDQRGRLVSPDLQGVFDIRSVDASKVDPRIAESELTVLCDVTAPLCGLTGATFSFGLQKGLSHGYVQAVDDASARFAELAEAEFGIVARNSPGSGAAGGLGFSFALLGGQLVSGADYVFEKVGLREKVKDVDWVLTGEGKTDNQSLMGKLPLKVAAVAKEAGASVALISGEISEASVFSNLFDTLIQVRPKNMPVKESMNQASLLLQKATFNWAKSFL